MPCLLRALVMIIILLFNAINIKYKIKIKEFLKIKPVYVYAKIISVYFLKEIRIKIYTHILILLKLLIYKKFHKIFTHPILYIYISLIVINKMHFIANWGGLF